MVHRFSSVPIAVFVASAVSLTAQCTNTWASFGGLPGVDAANAITNWDPDGSGPMSPRVVVAGPFAAAGTVMATGIAAWDPATGAWSPIGAGITSSVTTVLLALPNGDLIAGGAVYGMPNAQPLVRWDGATWTPFGGLVANSPGVMALAQLPNGDIAVGGDFTAAGTMPLPYVGVWNGTSWTSLGGGMDGAVRELTVLPNGDLIAVGDFSLAGGVAADGIARWDGSTWSPLGSGIPGYGRRGETAIVLPNGDLVVGGAFAMAGGVPVSNLARWDGTAWSAFGAGGVAGPAFYSGIGVYGLALLPNGDLVVGGYFTSAGAVAIPNLARWDGSTWSSFGMGIPLGAVNALEVLPGGALVVGGTFSVAGGIAASRVARWDGSAWSPLSTGTAPSDDVRAMVSMPDGSVVVGGRFQTAGAVIANGIARWDGAAWSPLGGGFQPYSRVNALVSLSAGGVLAGGNGFVSRWDGFSWTQLATGFVGGVPHADLVEAVAELPNGDFVVGGDFSRIGSMWCFGLARWDGSSWSLLGGAQPGEVHALATLDNGDLVVGGYLYGLPVTANGIARWNGTAWTTFGSGVGPTGEVYAIAPLPSGGFVVGGQFSTAGGLPASNLARWDGAAWSPLGAGTNYTVRSLHVLPNGDVLAAGDFNQAGGIPVNNMARWNGTGWSAIGSGVVASYPSVSAFAVLPDGDVLVGGSLYSAGGQWSPNLARLTTTCPATVQPAGAGCAGDAVTATLPWTGSRWRADASGLPTSALVAAVHGFATTSLPLTAVFATAVPGCTLHANPEVVDLIVGANGAATFQFVLPNAPVLAGIIFHHQMVSIALDATLAVTATNALQLTVGTF